MAEDLSSLVRNADAEQGESKEDTSFVRNAKQETEQSDTLSSLVRKPTLTLPELLTAVQRLGGCLSFDDRGQSVLFGLPDDAVTDAMRQAMQEHEAEIRELISAQWMETLERDLGEICERQAKLPAECH
jgi:hypothetical protein